ncbi:endoplasmic reticulum aminopeptidase 1-like [Magallana gigas]|uniref:endoplasmic reticulum aminopeptidase 1-like n=1 Tax=Magallana gigas TaxID=29159 RepID=UPI00333E69DF
MNTFILLMFMCYHCELKPILAFLANRNVSSESLSSLNREASEGFLWNNTRLPQSVIPLEYDIFLHPNLTEFMFSGKVEIKCVIRETTNFIVLHSKDLVISQTTLTTIPSNEQKEVRLQMKNDTDQLFLIMEDAIPKDAEILITIVFDGILTINGDGFYLSNYVDSNFIVRYTASTLFEPIDARRAFPCFDEPALKANFSMSIVREKKFISLFNMPRVHSIPFGENLMLDTFQQSVKMSTYLVAFAVCEFEGKSKLSKSGVNITVYYAPTSQIETVDFSLDAGVTILDYFSTLFEVSYPQPNLDMIAVPDLKVEAMENWGLITYKRQYLVMPINSGFQKKHLSALVVAHEIAHQWFGNIVTMAWWDDLWLNEGLTTFMQYLGVHAFNHKLHMEEYFIEKIESMREEDSKNTRVLDQPVSVPDKRIFDRVTYSKGASIVRMVRGLLGENAFMTGINNYLNQNKYSNVVSDDLWQALSNSSEDAIDLKAVMKTWMEERAYPLVTIHRNHSEVLISQEPFILMNTTFSRTTPRWSIPIQYGILDQHGNFSRNIVLLREETAIINISGHFKLVKGNYRDDGYYRVNYDPESWKAITDQLMINHEIFSPGDRANLLNDAITFIRSRFQLLNMSVVMNLLNYMEKETDFLPWISAQSALLDLTPGDIKPEVKVLMQNVARKATKALELLRNQLQAEENKKEEEEEAMQSFLEKLIRSINVRTNDIPNTTLGPIID